MSDGNISRRGLFGISLGAAAAAGVPLLLSSAGAKASSLGNAAQASLLQDGEAYVASIESAFAFQNRMMDAYATGATTRLAQSYSDQNGLLSTAFTYDNAVSIHAYLARGQADDLQRAQVLGNGLIDAQANNFPFNDGRFAQAYFVNVPAANGAYITPAANPFYFYSSAVGDQAWAGMALAQLYKRTLDTSYLAAAFKVANWIVANTYSTLGAGGYSFGTTINQYNQSVRSTNGKSTEHNIDTYAFFTMLAELTENGAASNSMPWAQLAGHALTFVKAMFNSGGGYFYTGTLGDQVTVNTSPIPEDVQTWSYLALLNNAYKQSIDWALGNLQTTDTASAPHSSLTGSQTISGLVFDTASLTTTAYDPHAVWLEGTAHTVAALIARLYAGREDFQALYSDLTRAAKLLSELHTAQAQLVSGQTVNRAAIPLGEGVVASSSVMDTGFGYTYGPSLHIGATGWYLIAALGANPFQLGYGKWKS